MANRYTCKYCLVKSYASPQGKSRHEIKACLKNPLSLKSLAIKKVKKTEKTYLFKEIKNLTKSSVLLKFEEEELLYSNMVKIITKKLYDNGTIVFKELISYDPKKDDDEFGGGLLFGYYEENSKIQKTITSTDLVEFIINKLEKRYYGNMSKFMIILINAGIIDNEDDFDDILYRDYEVLEEYYFKPGLRLREKFEGWYRFGGKIIDVEDKIRNAKKKRIQHIKEIISM